MKLRQLVAMLAAVMLTAALVGPTIAVPGPLPGSSSAGAVPVLDAAAPPAAQPATAQDAPPDESKIPHYFGPYSNWANSPQTLANAIVTIGLGTPTPASYGNPLIERAYASDDTPPAPLQPVLVIVPTPLPAGSLANFQTWNQANVGAGAIPSAGQTFHAYVLRPTGTANQYDVVFDSGALTVPAPAVPGTGEVATFALATPVAVNANDVIAFYGAGIPLDTGTGADLVSNPATTPPVQGAAITFGDGSFPAIAARTYSFAATVTPTVTDPGSGATASATVDPKTGGVSAITVTDPGQGYVLPPTVTITAPGLTPSPTATAVATISTGVVTGITVNEAGFDYTAPVVAISGGGSPSTPATGQAIGSVDIVTVTSGGNYAVQPIVEFSLPDALNGRRAVGVATMDNAGAVTGIEVTDPGTGYYTAPTLTIWDGAAGQLAPTPAVTSAVLRIDGVAITNGGSGYDAVPDVAITDATGSGQGASGTAALAVKGAVTGVTVTRAGAGYLTPGIKKFVDTLPGLNADGANNLGTYIPVGVPDTTTYPGTDYYEIGLVQYRHKFHSDLPSTLMRGYVQLSTDVVPGNHVQLTNADLDPNAPDVPIAGVFGVTEPQYLGPTIVASKDRPVRITFRNLLPTGAEGNLFLPTNTTLMGSGMGPNMVTLDANDVPVDMPGNGTVNDAVRNPTCGEDPKLSTCFSENRATLHLHGGITPWISDGTPHQWTTPAGEATDYPKGVSVSNVPDMPDPGPGAITFFYTNQQSARLMFYHDHAWGITRLNVYAGEAAGYVITDDAEAGLVADGLLPNAASTLPLVIQDKTFVSEDILNTDPTWDKSRWGGTGSLWAPHVYMPAQNPGDPSGMSSFGRWMYGPWFWPPATATEYGPIDNPYYDPTCDLDVPSTWTYQTDPFCEPALIPGTPNISVGMEAFNDTPTVNGTAYPKTTVDPKAYRFRILNAANDRFWNLSWYVADPTTGTLSEVALNQAEVAAAKLDPNVFPTPDTSKSPAGPNWIHIGTEGGFLPAPAVVPAQPTTWITDPTRFDVGNVDLHSLLLAPAERADTIVDFSAYRGKTLILYNDAPAAFPARVGCYDYYTDNGDLTPACAPTTLPGYGPNTRTIMQVKVSNATPATAYDKPNTTNDKLGQLTAAFGHQADGSGVFESAQNPIIVGQAAYNDAYGSNFTSAGWCNGPTPTAKCDGYLRINEQGGNNFKFDTLGAAKDGTGAQLSIPIQPKGIHDEMNSAVFDEFGRMTANIGLEAPGITPLTQNIILYPYVNPATELLDATSPDLPNGLDVTPIASAADGTQIWKITHNGVDTHPIHFHLYDVQLINRVTWDNIIIPPEPGELGWKETIRVSPLEDTIVAVRPILPALPFGVPDSWRVLNPAMPEGARGDTANGNLGYEAGFNNTDALGNPIDPIVNEKVNFNWEYVFHCHILSHEEMDMMRPVEVTVTSVIPDAPVLTASQPGSINTLNWTDGTVVNYADPTTWPNPKNEVGYKVERATVTGGVAGPWEVMGSVPANKTTFADTTAVVGTEYQYRVAAFNAAGSINSNVVNVTTLATAINGTVTAGATGLDGAIVYVFDANTSAYVGNAFTAGGGAYSISLPSGSYKLWVQTNLPGYPDQAYGPDGTFANATAIDLTVGSQTANVVLVASAASFTLSGTVTAGATGLDGAIVYVFDANTSAYVNNAFTAGGGAYSLVLPLGTYNLWIQTNLAGYPDQAYGPDGTFANATDVDLTAANQTANVVLVASAASFTLSGTVTAGGTGLDGAIVYVFDANTSAYVNNAFTAGGGAYSLVLPSGTYKLWIQTNLAGYPDQAYGPDGTFANATAIDLTAGNQAANVVLVAAP